MKKKVEMFVCLFEFEFELERTSRIPKKVTQKMKGTPLGKLFSKSLTSYS
jgi:hypothetical protein